MVNLQSSTAGGSSSSSSGSNIDIDGSGVGGGSLLATLIYKDVMQ